MKTEKEVRKVLLEIESNHYDFFKENEKSIVDYILIIWEDPVYLKVKDNRMPINIWKDLSEVFEIV